ncbi:MAG: addiction module protein [Syntrophobacteraceae bacterium]
MESKLDEIITAALDLNIEERAKVVAKLLLSLDEPSESEVERQWIEEAQRRLNDFRAGRVQGTPADDVFQRAYDDIS